MVWAPEWMRVEVSVPPEIQRRVTGLCKAAFPRETVVFLLGQKVAGRYEVEDLWVPEGIKATANHVVIRSEWFEEAAGVAEEDDMVLLGAVHSHPYRKTDSRPPFFDNTPSHADFRLGWQGICGICKVVEGKSRGLRARVDYFGPAPPVKVCS